MWMRATDRKLFAGLLVALVALAWLALLVWGQSPYDRYLDHGQLSEVTGKDASLLVLFVVGWTVMVFAMMLPTSLPLITLFHTMTRGCPDHTSLVTLLIVGYVSVWMWFGVAVHAGDLALHEGIERVAWLDENSWVIGAGTLMVAGVYQFTPLKYHCLDKCRSPLMFIPQQPRTYSTTPAWCAGVFCGCCCWSLMLLMFAMGAGNIGWMLVLGGVMAIEKNMPWGRQLGKPLGILLLVGGILVAVMGATDIHSW